MTGFKQEGGSQERRKIIIKKSFKSYISYDFENSVLKISINPYDDIIEIFQLVIKEFKEHNYFK